MRRKVKHITTKISTNNSNGGNNRQKCYKTNTKQNKKFFPITNGLSFSIKRHRLSAFGISKKKKRSNYILSIRDSLLCVCVCVGVCGCVFVFKFIYLLWERKKKSACGRDRKRGRERIPSRLCTVSTEPHVGLKVRSMTWAEIKSWMLN